MWRPSLLPSISRFHFAKIYQQIPVHREKLVIKFARSSGPGGQNVNKLSTKVELRLDLGEKCEWLPNDVKERLKEYNKTYLTKDDEIVIFSQKFRTQERNLDDGIKKMQNMIDEATVPPKIRKFRQKKKETEEEKKYRVDQKRKRSQIKRNRQSRWD